MGLHYATLLAGISSGASQRTTLQADASQGTDETHTGGHALKPTRVIEEVTVCSLHQVTIRACDLTCTSPGRVGAPGESCHSPGKCHARAADLPCATIHQRARAACGACTIKLQACLVALIMPQKLQVYLLPLCQGPADTC